MENRQKDYRGIIVIASGYKAEVGQVICIYCEALADRKSPVCPACRQWLDALAAEQQERLGSGEALDDGWILKDGQVRWQDQIWHTDKHLRTMNERANSAQQVHGGKRLEHTSLDVLNDSVRISQLEPRRYKSISKKNLAAYALIRRWYCENKIEDASKAHEQLLAMSVAGVPSVQTVRTWIRKLREEYQEETKEPRRVIAAL